MHDPDTERVLDMIDGIVYADVFSVPTTLDEAHRFARVRVDREELAGELAAGAAADLVIRDRSGVYTLRDRTRLVEGSAERKARAERLRRRATRVCRVLRHAPFVRGLLLTGSVAAGDAAKDADVDLLVVVADDRVGTAFLLLAPISRLIGRHLFCPNFYLCERALALEARDVYVGHEIAQARAVIGSVEPLRNANPWLAEMFPNLDGHDDGAPYRPSGLQRVLELLLRGGLGEAVERRARAIAAARLRAHYDGTVPEAVTHGLLNGTSLRFHGSEIEHSVPEQHATRRRMLASDISSGRVMR